MSDPSRIGRNFVLNTATFVFLSTYRLLRTPFYTVSDILNIAFSDIYLLFFSHLHIYVTFSLRCVPRYFKFSACSRTFSSNFMTSINFRDFWEEWVIEISSLLISVYDRVDPWRKIRYQLLSIYTIFFPKL